MESVYRAWLRARKEGLSPKHSNELNRELQTALGTAKWQLEEFEKAVCQSYRNIGDDITVTRHRQFVSAIEDQISCVETALKISLNIEGKKPFRWVNLDEEECDDLAHFLSGSNRKEDCNYGSEMSKMQMSNPEDSLEEIVAYVEDITSDNPAWSSLDRNVLEIVIDKQDREPNALIEVTPKKKGSKPFSWINPQLRGGLRSQGPQVLRVKSIRFALAFMLTIFLVVPFLIHSSNHVEVL